MKFFFFFRFLCRKYDNATNALVKITNFSGRHYRFSLFFVALVLPIPCSDGFHSTFAGLCGPDASGLCVEEASKFISRKLCEFERCSVFMQQMSLIKVYCIITLLRSANWNRVVHFNCIINTRFQRYFVNGQTFCFPLSDDGGAFFSAHLSFRFGLTKRKNFIS